MEQKTSELLEKVMNHVHVKTERLNHDSNESETQSTVITNKVTPKNALTSISGKKEYRCPICNTVCSSNEQLLKHIHMHKYGKQPIQTYRKKVYPVTETKNIVNSSNNGNPRKGKKYECPICHNICLSNDDLLEHIHVHKYGNQSIHNNRQKINNTGNYRCPICRMVYETNDELLKHVYVHKFGKEPEVVNNVQHISSNSSEKKEYKCPICHFICNGNKDLSIHVQTHVKVSLKYKCLYCGKGFDRPSALEIHTRTHTKEKPFQCSICDKFFNTAGQLVKHMKAHIPENLNANETESDEFGESTDWYNTVVNSAAEIDYLCLDNEKTNSSINDSHEIFHDNEADSLGTIEHHVRSDTLNSDLIENDSRQKADNVTQNEHSSQCDNEENFTLNIKQEILNEDEGNFVFLTESTVSESNNSSRNENQEEKIDSKDDLSKPPNMQLGEKTEHNDSDYLTLANIKKEDTSSHQLQNNIKQEVMTNKNTYCVDGLTSDTAVNQNIDVVIKDELEDVIEHEELFNINQDTDPLSCVESVFVGNSFTQDSFVCHLCPIVFDNKDKLEMHIEKHLIDTESSYELEDQVQPFSSDKNQLDTSTYSIFVCSLCQSRFNLKSELKDHVIKSHGVIDTTRCPVCWKRFKDVTVLVKHLFIHTYDDKGKKKDNTVTNNEVNVNLNCSKTYKCPLCSEIFNTNDELLNHVTKHKKAIQKKSKYKCEYCGFGFEKPSQLKIHIRKHTREKAFDCPKKCGERFMYAAQVKKHLLSSHL
ncbi:unnamed protein product [Meganyctiphanes norvegica]|uniref:C2H2-type domain-containing protein n=1 Tax=Meganyctiphanes norvegica TaxID=48144 RepID=A0AAV2RWF9_MEGNR